MSNPPPKKKKNAFCGCGICEEPQSRRNWPKSQAVNNHWSSKKTIHEPGISVYSFEISVLNAGFWQRHHLDHMPMTCHFEQIVAHAIDSHLGSDSGRKTLAKMNTWEKKHGTCHLSDEQKHGAISQIMIIQERSIVGPITLDVIHLSFKNIMWNESRLCKKLSRSNKVSQESCLDALIVVYFLISSEKDIYIAWFSHSWNLECKNINMNNIKVNGKHMYENSCCCFVCNG